MLYGDWDAFEGAFFPEFNNEEWDSEFIKDNEDKGITYKHVLYKRKK